MSEFEQLRQSDIADAFGVSTKIIRKRTRDGMPRNPDGTYNLSIYIKWRIDQYAATSKILASSLLRRIERDFNLS